MTRNFLLLGMLFVGVMGAALFFYAARKPVTLQVNGEVRQLHTPALTVADLLQQTGFDYREGDEISPGLATLLLPDQTVALDQAAWVFVRAGGQVRQLWSAERVPALLLDLAGLELSSASQLFLDGRVIDPQQPLPYSPTYALEVKDPLTFNLWDGEEAHTITSSAPSFGSAMWEQGLRLRHGDLLEPGLEAPLTGDPVEARLRRGQELLIEKGGETSYIYTAAGTVAEALAQTGFALQGLDYSLPPEDTPLPVARIKIVHVEEEILVEMSPLPFESEYQPLPELELDQKQVVQAGEYGLTARRIRILYEDGTEVAREVEEEWAAVPPKNRVVGYGTHVVMRTAETADGVIQYWRALSMYATSYHPATTSNTTASGMPLRKGVAAVDRRLIPFYTRMYIPGYGEAVAADVGGGVRGRMIDLGYSDEDYVSWHHWVTVYFLWPPPENIVWMIP